MIVSEDALSHLAVATDKSRGCIQRILVVEKLDKYYQATSCADFAGG
jgi:hypothetical protein